MKTDDRHPLLVAMEEAGIEPTAQQTMRGLKVKATHRAQALAHELTAWQHPTAPYLATAECKRCGGHVCVDERDGTISGATWSASCQAWRGIEAQLR